MAKSYINEASDDRPAKEPERCRFDIGEHVLVLMALAFLTTNSSMTHRIRGKIFEFLKELDDRQYSENQDIVWRIALARSIAKAVMSGNARTLPAIEHRVLEDTEWAEYHAAFFEAYREDTGHASEGMVLENELDDEDVAYIDEYVSTRLRFSYLWKARGFFREIADRIDAGDMGEVPVFNDRVMSVMERVVQRGRHARAMSSHESMDFSTGESSFEAAIRAAHAARNKPQSVVRTGVRLLNDMLSGGYEGSRVYIHFGRSGCIQ